MDQALVAALRGDLLRRELRAVDEALRVALAKRDVRGRVLVEQRVVEQQSALRDRRGMRHQGHLAETARALVGIEHLVQYLLAARSLRIDDPAVLETHRDLVDQRALVGQRLRAHDMAVDAPAMRRGEDLFGRDIGVAADAVLGERSAAFPFMAVGEPDGEVSARSRVLERAETL